MGILDATFEEIDDLLIVLLIVNLLPVLANRTSFLSSVISRKVLKRVFTALLVISVVIILSPFSFLGYLFDCIIVVATIYVFFILLYNEEHRELRKTLYMVYYSISITVSVIFILFPFFLYSLTNAENIFPKYISKTNKYSINHTVKHADFMYSGDHVLKIKKIMFIPILEREYAKVNLGSYSRPALYYNDKSGKYEKRKNTNEKYVIENDTLYIFNYNFPLKDYQLNRKIELKPPSNSKERDNSPQELEN